MASTQTQQAPSPAGPPPLAVWALVALQLLLGIGWSLLAPIYRAPDETQHVDLALALSRGDAYPGAFDRRVSAQVVASAARANLSRDGAPYPERDLRFVAAEAHPRTDRPSFAALAPDEPTDFANQMPQHPPLYYLLAGGVLSGLPEATAFDVQIWLLRVLGALLVAPLPLLAWLVARRVTDSAAVAMTAATLPLAIPQLAHVAGSVSNDGLLVVTTGAAIAAGAGVLGGDLRARTAVAAALTAALALLTKAFGLAVLPFLAAAYALQAWRRRTAGATPRPAIVSGLVAVGGAVVLGGWWYVRNLLRYGTPQPEAFPFTDLPADPVVDLGFWVPYAASRFVLRFWGQPGWVELALPWPLVWVLTALLAAGVVAGLARRRAPVPPVEAAVLLVPLFGIVAIVVPGAFSLYASTGVPAGVQGRYFHPALPGLAVVAASGAAALLRRGTRWLPLAVLLVGLAVQGVAGVLALNHWYGPVDSPGVPLALRGLVAWSPVPGPFVAAAGIGVTLAVLVAVGCLVLHALRGPARPLR